MAFGGAAGLSFRQFREAVFRVPSGPFGRLVVPTLHREQERFTSAMDAVDANGRRLFPEFCLHWSKKTSKSSDAGTAALWHQTSDPHERQERRIGIASFDEDQSRIIFGLAKQTVDRHPWLRDHITVGRTEMVFREEHRDDRTGGTYTMEHVLIALPRDVKGSHGEAWSAVIRDEIWSEPNHDFSESLILSPTKSGFTLYCSYHAPRVMARAGVPLHDILQRAKAGDPKLFYSYIGGEGVDAPWNVAPWVTREWVEQQRRMMAAVPSRFRRVVLNEPAGADSGLISSEELSASLMRVEEPQSGAPGVSYVAAIDLGLTNDWTALVIGHLDVDARAVIDVVRSWRGTKDQPVDLGAVEDAIVDVARRFNLSRVILDQWQSAHMTQRLVRRGVPAKTVGVEQARLDRIISVLKQAFSGRLIRINSAHTQLVAQLESVQILEGRGGRRDLLKFAPSGKGLDAGSHDDIVVAVGLVLEHLSDNGRALGAVRMAEMPDGCRREQWHGRQAADCYLMLDNNHLPTDPLCIRCEAHQSTLAACRAYSERTGYAMDVREFLNMGLIQPTNFVALRRGHHQLRKKLCF
ncbi:MAG: hypothetical protein ABI603_01710 [Acidobacteriota bacterium]